jgi:hypothetical protein
MSRIYQNNKTTTVAAPTTEQKLEALMAHIASLEAQLKAKPTGAVRTEKKGLDLCSIDKNGKVEKPRGEYRKNRMNLAGAKWQSGENGDIKGGFHYFTDLAAGKAWVEAENALIKASAAEFKKAEITAGGNITKVADGLLVSMYVKVKAGEKQSLDQQVLSTKFGASASPADRGMIVPVENFVDFIQRGGWEMFS